MSDYRKIIEGPVITEKSSLSFEKSGRYSLYISVLSNKKQVREAVKWFYGVDVESISVVVIKGKSKRFKGVVGRRKMRKKAYFSLRSGQSINMMGV